MCSQSPIPHPQFPIPQLAVAELWCHCPLLPFPFPYTLLIPFPLRTFSFSLFPFFPSLFPFPFSLFPLHSSRFSFPCSSVLVVKPNTFTPSPPTSNSYNLSQFPHFFLLCILPSLHPLSAWRRINHHHQSVCIRCHSLSKFTYGRISPVNLKQGQIHACHYWSIRKRWWGN